MAFYLFNEDLASIIDLEVIKTRTNVPSETTEMRNEFSTDLLERDVCCVWTGTDPFIGDGFHIIPYKRGSDVCFIIFCWEYVSSSGYYFSGFNRS